MTHKIYCIPNSHVDVAWQWEIKETRDVVIPNTFRDMLALMDKKEIFTYTQSCVLFYEWIEHDQPEMFKKLQKRVAEDKWELVGGSWVESDMNLPDGESLIRQHLVGQHYLLEKFGRIATVAWLPDVFGANGNLPQILKHCGLEYFFTAKMCFNLYCRSIDAPDGVDFPYTLFIWQGIDGTQMLAYNAPVLYNSLLVDETLINHIKIMKKKMADFPISLFAFGKGDHGGGPTVFEVELVEAHPYPIELDKSPAQLQITTSQAFFDEAKKYWQQLPIHNDELYLENHRGCHTTEGRIKKYNRSLGHMLLSLEKLASIGEILFPDKHQYPTKDLERIWKVYLLNQFHDILAGSSIRPAHETACVEYAEIKEELEKLINKTLQTFTTTSDKHFAFNPLPWKRSGLIYLDQKNSPQLTLIENVGSLGFKKISEIDLEKNSKVSSKEEMTHFILENEYLQIKVSKNTGNIQSIFAKKLDREFLIKAGNHLQLLTDNPDFFGYRFSAWNVAYSPQITPIDKFTSIAITETGPLRATIQIKREFSESSCTQEISLIYKDPIVYSQMTIDWQETHHMLKVAFPVNVDNNTAYYEIPCGAISRPTSTETYEGQAKFENAAIHWFALTDQTQKFGAAVINDCKYGCDVRDNVMRLTLLRSSMFPCQDCDKGQHTFRWGFYPYAGNWQQAEVVKRGYEFNVPFLCQSGDAPDIKEFITVSKDNIILTAIKKSLDGNGWILRFYESSGIVTETQVSSIIPWTKVVTTDGLERVNENIDFSGNSVSLSFRAYEIISLRVFFEKMR